MVHEMIDLVTAVTTGICEVHGTSSAECGATKEAATLGILAIGGAALGNAIGGRGGALIGGVIGFIAATQVNEANDSLPTA